MRIGFEQAKNRLHAHKQLTKDPRRSQVDYIHDAGSSPDELKQRLDGDAWEKKMETRGSVSALQDSLTLTHALISPPPPE
jgi:hypothetical protein